MRRAHIPYKSIALRVLALCGGLWFVTVILYRFIPPPLTPLIAGRAIMRIHQGLPAVASWDWIEFEAIPPTVARAVVAAEDSRFAQHWGVDFGAVNDALESRSSSQFRGASTITMQTVKNLFLWPGRSYIRKGIELMMSPIAGFIWGKRCTLELYLNVAEWGDGIYGIEAAAKHYYNRSAARLTLPQAAALAAILPAPRVLSPLHLTSTARKRYQRIVREAQSVKLPGH